MVIRQMERRRGLQEQSADSLIKGTTDVLLYCTDGGGWWCTKTANVGLEWVASWMERSGVVGCGVESGPNDSTKYR